MHCGPPVEAQGGQGLGPGGPGGGAELCQDPGGASEVTGQPLPVEGAGARGAGGAGQVHAGPAVGSGGRGVSGEAQSLQEAQLWGGLLSEAGRGEGKCRPAL